MRGICPPDHAHGDTSTCYLGHRCGCRPCLDARTEYQFWRRGMIAAGRVDALDRIIDGRGVARRLQALMALGYSARRIGARLDVTDDLIIYWLKAARVRESTLARVSALYEQLASTPPTTDTPGDKASVNRTRNLARRRGYAEPLAWDDIDTDDELPTGEDGIDVVAIELAVSGQRVRLTIEERHEAVRQLNARLYFDTEIATMLSVSEKTIERDRRRLGIAAVDKDVRAAATGIPSTQALAA